MTNTNPFGTTSREELAREMARDYVEKIGYDPFQDDPSITLAEIAKTLAEWDIEASMTNVK